MNFVAACGSWNGWGEEMSRRLSQPGGRTGNSPGAGHFRAGAHGFPRCGQARCCGLRIWFTDLVRDGHSAGIAVIVSGDRELVTARFFSAVPNRIYFPRGSSEESRLAWPQMPEIPAVPGRAVATGAIAGERAGRVPALRQGRACPGRGARPRSLPRTKPFRVDPLPLQVPLAGLLARIRQPGGHFRSGQS